MVIQMQKIYCDICNREIMKSDMPDSLFQVNDGRHSSWEWDMCPVCKGKFYENNKDLFKDY